MAEKMKGKNVVKRPVAASRVEIPMDDKVLDSVAGGFVESEGYAKKQTIICPYCGNKRESKFEWWEEEEFKQNGYTCQACEKDFWVDGNGYYYDVFNEVMSFNPLKKK